MFENVNGTSDERLELARRLCRLDGNSCNQVALLLLYDGREVEVAYAAKSSFDPHMKVIVRARRRLP